MKVSIGGSLGREEGKEDVFVSPLRLNVQMNLITVVRVPVSLPSLIVPATQPAFIE